jgi:hypothetical protein
MMRARGTVAVAYLALYLNAGLAALVHKHTLNQETTAATFLVNQKDADDVKSVQLSDSIQGLFDPSTLAADKMQASPTTRSSKAVAATKPSAEKVVVKLQSKHVADGIEHHAAKPANVAQKEARTKPALGPKLLANKMQNTIAQAKREEVVSVTKASKAKVEKEVTGVVQKLKAFVSNAHQRKADKRIAQKAVSKMPEPKYSPSTKKKSKLIVEKSHLVQAKQGVSTETFKVHQREVIQPQHQASRDSHMAMMPSKLQSNPKEQTVSVAPKLTPVAMKSLPMNLAKLPTPLQAAGSITTNTLGPLKIAPMLAKIPVAGKPVHPGGPVPVTKLQVAEKANVGSDSNKNTNFSWFPFSHASNSSSTNASAPVHSWFVFSHDSNSTASNASEHQNISVAVRIGNATMDNATKDNKSKEIEKEKEVEALPMASFAMDLSDEPSQNKTEQLPRNKSASTPVLNATARAALKAAEAKKAAEKAAWDEREKVLREEIKLLKARLENDTLEIKRHHPDDEQSPPATGTFNSQIDAPKHSIDDDIPVKKSEPMEPLIKDPKPKADWPSMKSVAAPITLRHVNSSEVPPQKEAMEAQAGDSNKVGLNTAFTGTPAKKVQSVMALDSTVQHDAVFTDASNDDSSAPVENATPASFSLWNSISSFFSSMFSRAPEAPVQHVDAPRKATTALLDTTQRRVGPQEYDKTAQATREEANHIIAPTNVWGELEEEDRQEEDHVRGEDQFERVRARTPESPHAESKEELAGRHGTDMSRFWSNLETEDAEIEKSVASQNLGEYERLTQDQEEKVTKADNQLQESKLHTDREEPLKHNDHSFLAKTIHEPWATLEEKDKVVEQRIHASPDLQMLQLRDSLQDSLRHH